MFIYHVKEKEDVLIESFGKYVKTTSSPGLKLKLPWPLQRVADHVPKGLFQDEAKLETKTNDDIFVTIPIKMHLQIFDSKKYHYDSSSDPLQQVSSRIANAVKQLTAKMDFADLYQARGTLSDQVREQVGEQIENLYGVRIVDVIVDEPQAPREIQESYNNVRASEREASATLNNAKAGKQASILAAEGRKEVLRLDGEGIAEQRAAIFKNYAQQFNALVEEGLSSEQAQQTILLAMANDTIRDAAEKGNMILSTTNTSEVLADIQTLGKTLTKPKRQPANDGAARKPKQAAPGS